jgi:hypothetical protein
MTAATILGHQDPKITAKHYSELRLADTLAAVEKLPPLIAKEAQAEYVAKAASPDIQAIKRPTAPARSKGGRSRRFPKAVARHDLREMGAPGIEPGTYGLKIRCSTY